jgi:hypothetical protein
VITYRLAAPVTGAVRVLVLGAGGDTLARLAGANTAGLHRVEWNLQSGGGAGGFGGGGRGGQGGGNVTVPGFPAGYNPRPAEARGAADSTASPAAVQRRLAAAVPQAPGGGGGGGGGGFGGFGAARPADTGDYRVVLEAGGQTSSTVLRVVKVAPTDRAVMVPAVR